LYCISVWQHRVAMHIGVTECLLTVTANFLLSVMNVEGWLTLRADET